eukprot:g17719.t1
MVGAEELPEMVATIHVVNHCDSEWSRIENDSILSLFLPWGLDSRQPAKTSQPSRLTESRSANWREWRNQTVESSTLIETWKSDVLSWLDDELAVGWVEDGILDLIFFAGNPSRGAFKEELDKLLSPGIFSDDCLGQSRFSESRCYRDGRVLHYVITSQTLKTSSPWRPDPLGAHAASLFVDQVDDEEQGFEESWSPCLLRLSSREVIYLLREDEGTSCGDGLWPDGTRFIGSWQEHTYHGHGQLLDQDGQLIYKGQWSQGMKHGEGLYYFYQEPSGSRDGSLDWLRKNRPWAIVRYEGYFSGAGQLVPRSLLTLDERHAAAVQEHFPLSSDDGLAFKPLQASGRPPKDHAAEFYSLDWPTEQTCNTVARMKKQRFGMPMAADIAALAWQGLCHMGMGSSGKRSRVQRRRH